MTPSTGRSPQPDKATAQTYWAVEIEPSDGSIVEYHGADRIELTGNSIRLFTRDRRVVFNRDQTRKILIMRTKKLGDSSE